MRITNGSMVRSHMYNTQQNLTRMSNLNQQLSTGKLINKVSDDPHKAIRIMNLNNEIKYNEKYNYNIDETVGWMNNSDSSLENLSNLLGEVQESIIKVGNGTYSQNEMKSINADINEKIKEMADILNTTYGGKHIFSGTNVDDAPIKLIENKDGTVALEFAKDKNGLVIANRDSLKADISDGVSIEYNVSVGDLFNITDENGNNINLLEGVNKVSQLMNDIANGDEQTAAKAKEELLGNTKSTIDKLFDHVVNERTSLGVRVSTAEKIKNFNEDNIVSMKTVLSQDQDVDQVEKFIELKSAELIYQASIQVGAKLMQSTILDYIR